MDNIKEVVWKEYCNYCKKEHYMTMKSCNSCSTYEVPRPKSEIVDDKCRASRMCDGCEAYQDHYAI